MLKKYALYCIVILLVACKESTDNKKVIDDLSLDWIVGNWQRIDGSSKSLTKEHWIKKDAATYLGLGYTLKSTDTVFKEYLELKCKNKIWLLTVTGVHDDATVFTINDIAASRFTAVNAAHDFPKVIKYRLVDTHLITSVSDDSTQIDFKFKRLID